MEAGKDVEATMSTKHLQIKHNPLQVAGDKKKARLAFSSLHAPQHDHHWGKLGRTVSLVQVVSSVIEGTVLSYETNVHDVSYAKRHGQDHGPQNLSWFSFSLKYS